MAEDLKTLLAAKVTKKSVTIAGHRTSISLEKPFWDILGQMAKQRQISLAALIAEIDEQRSINLSSALRLYVLHHK